MEIDKQVDGQVLAQIRASILEVIEDVEKAVNAWHPMKEKLSLAMEGIISEDVDLEKAKEKDPMVVEILNFLTWLSENNFTFLGYCAVKVSAKGNKFDFIVDEGSSLGVVEGKKIEIENKWDKLDLVAKQVLTSKEDKLLVCKSDFESKIHRPVHMDLVGVKSYDSKGEATGLHLFYGLFTSAAYNSSFRELPFFNKKIDYIAKEMGFDLDSHRGKALIHIIETLPRDDLFQASEDELLAWVDGILKIQDVQKTKFFARRDLLGRFYSCLVYVPRDKFSAELRKRIQELLLREFNGRSIGFSTSFSEAMLIRIHFVVRLAEDTVFSEEDFKLIEDKIVEEVKSWKDNLKDLLCNKFGYDKAAELVSKYGNAFGMGYLETHSVADAMTDIEYMREASNTEKLAINLLYEPTYTAKDILCLRLFQPEGSMSLSDIVPMLECLGFRILSQQLYELKPKDSKIWLNVFTLKIELKEFVDILQHKDIFKDAFYNIWYDLSESDKFNQLVLAAGLTWRQIVIMRAYARYLWQIGLIFSAGYIEEALVSNADIVKKILDIFALKFCPEDDLLNVEERNSKIEVLSKEIYAKLAIIENADVDKILRSYLHLINATLRTNYFQQENGSYKNYLSFKINPAEIPDMPLPKPMYEIFVYSTRVEGVHLRGAKVARGGLRWSDRMEDYRTEILGLMKAQMVKNAVIVPSGAKGGFIVKQLPADISREGIYEEGVACYKIFINGLLDITDNLVDGEIISPPEVVRFDGDDPYLVVAADKGTATFSDIANEIAINRGFWLGDAFASGGSAGYDHKKMGITARGAWESVKRHFCELGHDVQTEDFTVVGIGDMAGDVFGNGMLLSEHIRLVAAFNHMHIFIDPSPEAKSSFKERERLFKLARSTWQDYDAQLISAGGGVFSRKDKSIPISKEMQVLFDIAQTSLTPNELIKKILAAKVDLLWNGGIGTYVKAKTESHTEVGDRANDLLRINGADLRCRVVAEGGNLGFTQLGRIEYSLKGGKLNTDAIDNSAGVDCSDHEVNIKILLNNLPDKQKLSKSAREKLLLSMTDEVASLVLKNNIDQTLAISVSFEQSHDNVELHDRLLQNLYRIGKIDLELEFLPSSSELVKRKKAGIGLTRSEIAVFLAYAKTLLKEELLNSDILELPYIEKEVENVFPKVLVKKYKESIYQHALKREIVATQLSNNAINEMSFSFVYRLLDETSASVADIMLCYTIAKEIFSSKETIAAIEALRFKVNSKTQIEMIREVSRLLRRATRWLLKYVDSRTSPADIIKLFKSGVDEVYNFLPKYMQGDAVQVIQDSTQHLISKNVPKELAYKTSTLPWILSAFDMTDLSNLYNAPLEKVATIYYALADKLELGILKEEVKGIPVNNRWDALARASIRDDIDLYHRKLTIGFLLEFSTTSTIQLDLEPYIRKEDPLVKRWLSIVQDLRNDRVKNFTMYSVVVRELLALSQLLLKNN